MATNRSGRLAVSKKLQFFTGLHSLLSAGIDFTTSFSLIISSEQDPKLKQLLHILYEKVIIGSALWQSMQSSGCFSPLDYGVIRIGEQTGRIDESLEFLSDYYRKRIAQQRMIISSTSHPVVILCTAIIVVIFMMIIIVPMFEQVYSRMGGELPAITRSIISFSKSFPHYVMVLALLTGAGVLFFLFWGHTPKVRSKLASIILWSPLIGKIVKKNEQSRFCRLLYLLIASGVPLLHGLEMLQGIITFHPYQASLSDFCLSLRRGELLHTSMERYPTLYGSKFTTLVRVGEETHRLPQMLERHSEELNSELEYSLKQLGTMLEPVLIFFVGVLVAIILVSMYLPMFKLGGILG